MLHNRRFFPWFLFIAILFGLLVPSTSGSARGSSQPDLAAVDAFLQEMVQGSRIPGVAVAIVQGDRVIFNKGYGEAQPGEAVTPQTRFYIGSVTKSFTALAALQLVEQGKLDLDAPVQKYLPWFQVADEEASATITVRHLLNHTSGLSEKGDPNASLDTASLEEQARLLQYAHLTAPVGTRFQYYNQNYRLVGLLIEQVSGQPYGEYLRTHIFEPLGMLGTFAGPVQIGQPAQGYSRVFGFPLPQSQRFVAGALPSGYVVSTADDMAKFLLAQINNRQENGSPLLAPAFMQTMHSEPAGIQTGYGMGWMVMEGGNVLAHGGALDYFQSFVLIRQKEKLGLVILFNQSSIENMLLENNAIRSGLLNLLNEQAPGQIAYGWVGWLALVLALADAVNHVRLFWALPGWLQKTAGQNRTWRWAKVLAGIFIPVFIVFGLPWLVKTVQGGSPSWIEPYRMMPDLTIWLLVGLSLTLIRSLLHVLMLVRRSGAVG